MLKIWDSTNFRRTLGGLCLILAPVLFAINEITFPDLSGSGADQLAAAAKSHDLMLVDIYIGIASAILFIPAVMTLLHITQRRGVVLGHVAAVLSLAGIGLAGLALYGLQLMLWAMAGPGVDRQAMGAFIDQVQQNPAGLPLVLGHDLFAIGLILFGIAVWRSGFGYRWAGPALGLGIVLDIVGGTVGLPDMIISVISDAIFVTALAAIGLRVLLTTDAGWMAVEQVDPKRSTTVVPARA